MGIEFSDSMVTTHQEALADGVEQVLAPTVRYGRCVKASEGNGPSVNFVIQSSVPGLSVQLIVYQDSFHVEANGAEMSIELDSIESHQDWTETPRSRFARLRARASTKKDLRVKVVSRRIEAS